MTKTADVKEVAAHFSDFLREVALGHELVVTENDQPVARLIAAASGRESDREQGDLGQWVRNNRRSGRPVVSNPVKQTELADELFHRQ